VRLKISHTEMCCTAVFQPICLAQFSTSGYRKLLDTTACMWSTTPNGALTLSIFCTDSIVSVVVNWLQRHHRHSMACKTALL